MRGNKIYQIEYLNSVVKEDIPLLPKRIKTTIKKAIEERLMIDPIGFGKPLRYSLRGHRRLRIGDYRIVYRIDADESTVIIIATKHRKDIYEDDKLSQI
jgi:mRNA interferase RelE/StbE